MFDQSHEGSVVVQAHDETLAVIGRRVNSSYCRRRRGTAGCHTVSHRMRVKSAFEKVIVYAGRIKDLSEVD